MEHERRQREECCPIVASAIEGLTAYELVDPEAVIGGDVLELQFGTSREPSGVSCKGDGHQAGPSRALLSVFPREHGRAPWLNERCWNLLPDHRTFPRYT